MSWLEIIATANFLVLCAIAIGVYQAKHAVVEMHSGLASVLGRQEEMERKALWQLDGSIAGKRALPLVPLHLVVREILSDFRDFKHKWFRLHMKEFVEMEFREKGSKAIYEELKEEFPDLGDDPEFKKLFNDDGDQSGEEN